MASIDFIYFDLGNVLLHFSHQRACEQIAKLAEISAEQVWQVAFETRLVSDFEVGLLSDGQFCQGFSQHTGVLVDPTEFFLAFNDIFHFNQSIGELIADLNRIRFPAGILSNTCHAHWQFARQQFPILSECFSVSVLSFEEGFAKPNAGIYEAAIRKAKTGAERVFFVDDRPENVAGAIAAGIDAVLFNSADELTQQLRQRGVPV
jgi:glucose-1-phosphatase